MIIFQHFQGMLRRHPLKKEIPFWCLIYFKKLAKQKRHYERMALQKDILNFLNKMNNYKISFFNLLNPSFFSSFKNIKKERSFSYFRL